VTSATYNYFIKVDLNAITLVGTTKTTATYSFINKSVKDSVYDGLYWPILKDVGRITRAAGNPLPVVSIGSFTIRNDIGSFGANRKFSDVLQRYSPIEQDVTISIGQVDNDSDSVASWTQLAKGKCIGYQASVGDEPTLTFEVQSARITEKIITLEVDRSISGMSNAPDSSLGRTVPLILGDSNEIIPIRITADGSTSPEYAWGTCFSLSIKNSTSPTPAVYTKNYLDKWEQVQNNFTDRYGGTSGGTYTLNTNYAQAHGLADGYKSGLVTGAKLRAKGNGLATSTAMLTVFLLRYDPVTYNVIEEVARGRQALSVYDAQNAVSTNPIAVSVAFDEPAYLSSYNSEYKYALGWSVTDYQVNDMSLHFDNTATDVYFVRRAADAAGHEWKVQNTVSVLMYDLHMVTFTFSDYVTYSSAGGFTYSKLAITMDSVDTNQTKPPFDNVPLLLGQVTGLKDYSGGSLIQAVPDVVNRLAYIWDPTTGWGTSNEWDTTTYNTSRYVGLYNTGASPILRNRTPAGVFESKTTFVQMLTEVCRGTASKVGILSSGKLFMYPWGIEHTPAFNIPAGDIRPVSWSQGGIDTVVNRIKVNTKRSYLYRAREFENGLNDGRSETGFYYSTDFNAVDMTSVEVITRKSRLLYGDRPAEDSNNLIHPQSVTYSSTYLGGSTAEGSILAEYTLAKGVDPVVYATFVIPYHRYSTLEMFDVITFAHPDFPSFYGSNSEGEEPVYEDSSTGRTNLIDGYEWVRAETYRGQVEEISVLLPLDHAPALQITVRLITNAADIT
jgi:hypothetical protein